MRTELPTAIGSGRIDGIVVVDVVDTVTGRTAVVSANSTFLHLAATSLDASLGRDVLDVVGAQSLDRAGRRRVRALFTGHEDSVVELLVEPTPGVVSWVEVQVHPVASTGHDETPRAMVTFRDVSAERSSRELLAHAASHDPLTRLSNRALLLDDLGRALTVAHAAGDRLTVLFADLDHFKLVNDTFGHHAGDQVLQEFALRLRHCVGATDLVGRFGGDEFVIVHREDSRASGVDTAERILAAMAVPFEVEGRQLVMTASLGLARSDLEDREPDRVLRNADTALFEAKRLGRGRVESFTDDLRRRVVDRVELEAELRLALSRGQLCLHYQPQVDLQSGRMVGVEALARWSHPERGLIPPVEFIPIAEAAGLIGEIGQWVMVEACRQMAEWRERSRLAPASLTVNLSPLQLDRPGLIGEVASALEQSGLEPSALCLELTESALMGRTTGIEELRQLSALGVYIGIDDFGTGYSSLARLRDLPIEVLKIDKSFVDGLGTDPDDSAIVESIMSLSHAMGLHVIAEGVESARQAEALTRLGCPVAQGFLFARPCPPDELLELGHRRLWKPILGDDGAADGPGGIVHGQRATRRGRRRFIQEFLDQIGVPMDDDLEVTP